MNENCGVIAVYSLNAEKNVISPVIHGLLDLQNRGQLGAGFTSYNPSRRKILQTYKGSGTVHEVFKLHNLNKTNQIINEYSGYAAIGHNRYATSGDTDPDLAQPFERVHGRKYKWFSVCFNGNIANYEELKTELEENGYHLTYDTDTEVMMHFVSKELEKSTDLKLLFYALSQKFDGAYNIAYLDANGNMAVARDPKGFKPLCYGVKNNLLVVASESIVLTRMGFNSTDIEPGHMIYVKNGNFFIEKYVQESVSKSACFFEWVYFSNLGSILDGGSVYKIREKIGELLANQEKRGNRNNGDRVVLSVPETANTMANSFAYHMGLPFVSGLIRNSYVGRTFIEKVNRQERVKLKFTVLREVLEGKFVYLIDDTLVRGTTMNTVIKEIKEKGGVKEVHVRIGTPPIISPCFYGIDMATREELFAHKFLDCGSTVPEFENSAFGEMAGTLGANSLDYLKIEDLFKAIDKPTNELCAACITGKYPTKWGQILINNQTNNQTQ